MLAWKQQVPLLLANLTGALRLLTGFGWPVIEAQACGTPVIATNFSAQTELVGAGWLVRWQGTYDPPQGAFLAMPNVNDIYLKLQEAYDARNDQELRIKARQFANGYDADYVYGTYWRPFLAELESEMTASNRKKKAYPR